MLIMTDISSVLFMLSLLVLCKTPCCACRCNCTVLDRLAGQTASRASQSLDVCVSLLAALAPHPAVEEPTLGAACSRSYTDNSLAVVEK